MKNPIQIQLLLRISLPALIAAIQPVLSLTARFTFCPASATVAAGSRMTSICIAGALQYYIGGYPDSNNAISFSGMV
jgi:hypothetical protein